MISESDNTLVRLINSVIDEAINHRASDIHIETEPAPRNVRVRLRIDGDLVPYLELPARYRFAMVARIKIMASMDISEHRKPQDGKIDFARFGGPPVKLRVVTVPTSRGLEDVVLRPADGRKAPATGEHRPEPCPTWQALRSVVQKSYGLVLVCGPTGCGKTTTLHSVVRDINTAGRKIWTAEDPIEITQEGLRQVQVNPRIGWTFAAAMRTFLARRPRRDHDRRDARRGNLRASPSRPRSPDTWCCPPFTPTRRPRALHACSKSAWTRSTFPTLCSPSWHSAWCAACAPPAARPRSPTWIR